MIKKFVAFMLICAVFQVAIGPGFAATNFDNDAERAEKVKKAIIKLGTGESAIVNIKLKDNTKIEGFVSEISDEYFVVMNNQTGVGTTVPYPSVKQIKGNNLSTKTKIKIGVGIALGILLIYLAVNGNIGRRNNHPLEDEFKKHPLPTPAP